MAAVAIAPDGKRHPIRWVPDELIPASRYRRATDPTWMAARRCPSRLINRGVLTATGQEIPDGWTVAETHGRLITLLCGGSRRATYPYVSAQARADDVRWGRDEARQA